MSETVYEELAKELERGGPEAAFTRLAERLKADKKHHELFDARLMQARHRLGLPIVLASGLDDLPEPQRTQVEAAYLDACREAGGLLLEEGRVREAWMYLRPVGDKPAVAAALARIEPTDENLEEIIEVALHEGTSPKRGFELVLGHYGTCNAITMFDSTMHRQPREARQEVAGLLVRHLHKELVRNLQAEVARQEGQPPQESSIAALVADRDWLFSADNYHIDTSHLSAVVRFARYVTEPEVLRLALDLTEYGRRLSRQYQYAGEEPFADAHVAHALFFRAQLGEGVEEALAYFRERAEAAAGQGAGPAEVYVALLNRLGRHRDALEASAALIPPNVPVAGFAPTPSELARLSGDFARHREICRSRGDLLGYTAALMEERAAAR
jgi:hypothetical protein